MFLLFVADALARVCHHDAEHVALHSLDLMAQDHIEGHVYLSAVGRELIGVAQEVVDNLAYFVGIECYQQLGQVGMEGHGDIAVAQDAEGTADVVHERHNVHPGEVQLLLVLVKLAEVENLVYQRQESGGVAVNQFQLTLLSVVAFLLNQVGKGRDNERQGCAKLMTHVGEEVEFQFVQLFCLADALLHPLMLKFLALLLQHPAAILVEDAADEHEINEDGPAGEIEGGMDAYLQFAHLVVDRSVAVHHFH